MNAEVFQIMDAVRAECDGECWEVATKAGVEAGNWKGPIDGIMYYLSNLDKFHIRRRFPVVIPPAKTTCHVRNKAFPAGVLEVTSYTPVGIGTENGVISWEDMKNWDYTLNGKDWKSITP